MLFESINSFLTNGIVNFISFLLLVGYTISGMSYVDGIFNDISDKKKMVAFFIVPFILSLFSFGFIIDYKGFFAYIFGTLALSFLSFVTIIGYGESSCDKE